MRRILAVALASAALALAGCARASAPVATVTRVLELRSSRSTDASAYAPFFTDTGVAAELAARDASATGSPIPAWETPYVSAEASGTADVVVVWKPDGSHEGWAKATVFHLERSGSEWRIVDAATIPSGGVVPSAGR